MATTHDRERSTFQNRPAYRGDVTEGGTTKMYTVISTSKWIGDSWLVESYHSTRKEAVSARDSLLLNTADFGAVAVIGSTHPCEWHGGDACEIGDTSRVHVTNAPHLTSRHSHIRLDLGPAF